MSITWTVGLKLSSHIVWLDSIHKGALPSRIGWTIACDGSAHKKEHSPPGTILFVLRLTKKWYPYTPQLNIFHDTNSMVGACHRASSGSS